MLSDDEILGLWSEGKAHAPARPVLGSKKVIAFARAVERAAYERAAQECEKLIKRRPEDKWPTYYDHIGKALADAIRALKTKDGA